MNEDNEVEPISYIDGVPDSIYLDTTTNPKGDEVMTANTIGFKRLNEDSTIPTKAHATDSGFDLYAAEDVVIEPGETKVIPTGIAVQLPEGMEAQVRPRSGVTAKTKLRVQLGTIDNEYTGDIGVIVDNMYCETSEVNEGYEVIGGIVVTDARKEVMDGTYLIRKGDRIAQLVVQHLPQVEVVEVDSLDETVRGEGGFGSTGVSKTKEMIHETISDNYEALKRMEDD